MISGMWNNCRLICGNPMHGGSRQEMYVRDTGEDAFYACPKYYPDNRENDEQPCMNRISVQEMTNVFEKLSEKKLDDEENGGQCFLKNFRFETKVGKYKVLEENANGLVIEALNKKARKDF